MRHTIQRLGHHGDGIAPGPVYVPRTLPGEVIEGEQTGDRIGAPRILVPSPHRIAAPCPHYRVCGGCALQHADDGFVADWKVGVVRAALTAQGIDTSVRGPATSPANSRRRAVLSGRRTRKGTTIGFHGRASGAITEIPGCRLLHPAIMAGFAGFDALVRAGGSRKGELALHVTVSDAGLDVAVEGGKPLDGPLRNDLAGLAGQHDLARLSWNGDPVVEGRAPVQRFGRAAVTPPPGAFLQATAEGQAALVHAVRRADGPARRIADLFAGCGTFTLPLAEEAQVHAVEGAPSMLAALDRGWRHAEGLRKVVTETRDLFRRPLLPDELNRFDAVVIDPPRAGAEAQVAEIARAAVPVVASVSCNPVTFARDARVLTDAGFTVDWVEVVDQFRWSPHVELAARLSRSHMRGT